MSQVPNLVRLRHDIVYKYVGFQCLYSHGRGKNKKWHTAIITKVSSSGKSITIDNPNWPRLGLASTKGRAIYVFI